VNRDDVYINRTPTLEQAGALTVITEEAIRLDKILHRLLPAGRYRSLALTALEECSMWAKKAAVNATEPADDAFSDTTRSRHAP
jgi:hypothetical protein